MSITVKKRDIKKLEIVGNSGGSSTTLFTYPIAQNSIYQFRMSWVWKDTSAADSIGSGHLTAVVSRTTGNALGDTNANISGAAASTHGGSYFGTYISEITHIPIDMNTNTSTQNFELKINQSQNAYSTFHCLFWIEILSFTKS
jgi:hypothetical protein